MKILIDMNLSPLWCAALKNHAWEALHWSEVGDPRAPDREIVAWARANQFVVFTHDLDFGAMLAATQATGPSVIQVRAQDVSVAHLEQTIVTTLQRFQAELEAGALIIVDEAKARVRVLPLQPTPKSE
jgi:predicted nuclease of predicted toxin-antitoxin system